MTDKEKLAKVRAEIERRKKEVRDNIFELGNSESERIGLFDRKEIYDDLLSFINSMQEEPKQCMYSTANYTNADRLTLCKDCEELCKYNQKTAAESLGISQEAYDEIVDKCLYGSEVELVNNGDLPKEEPVSEDLEEAAEEWDGSLYRSDAFRGGANWQKQQLMANAVDGQIYKNYMEDGVSVDYGVEANLDVYKHNFADGEKVKVIIIKED